ncbi:septum formation protein Maf [Mariprofundus erugo]|uniref:7-methyl-GTP pyrophosphatase n=1 Tax=Mariprofundus erugo TaxID=2528639 RepID=A0A5R9GYQ0_9PROT|nr:Maf family protein [Mariprofundus erugo]TLS68932.1 septum formation protein Maf [Mariprofundus erugo]TLS75227.1 septum formation protein Maf [Mariprofundus erugo]
MTLILASTSPYRRALLQRLTIPFEQVAPAFIEAVPGSMEATELVRHNTMGKARAVLADHPDATIIGSDQLALCGEHVLGKPGSIENAAAQLHMLSGQRVTFLTGLCLLTSAGERYETIPYHVYFRHLTANEIHRYISIEQPVDCAGSFKSEGLGISLFEKMEGEDPTALIGLPLIRLSQWLHPLAPA